MGEQSEQCGVCTVMCFPHVETNYYQIRIQSTAGAGTAGTAGMTEVMVVKTLVFPSQLCWPDRGGRGCCGAAATRKNKIALLRLR